MFGWGAAPAAPHPCVRKRWAIPAEAALRARVAGSQLKLQVLTRVRSDEP